MAVNFKIGDLVWAKLKGFPAWPGRIIQPKENIRKPPKKSSHFVFFFGSENYAWISDECIWHYARAKDRFMPSQRIPRGFKEAVEAIEDAMKSQPEARTKELPSIEDELAEIFPGRPPTHKENRGRPKSRPSPAVPKQAFTPSSTQADKTVNGTPRSNRRTAPVANDADVKKSDKSRRVSKGEEAGTSARRRERDRNHAAPTNKSFTSIRSPRIRRNTTSSADEVEKPEGRGRRRTISVTETNVASPSRPERKKTRAPLTEEGPANEEDLDEEEDLEISFKEQSYSDINESSTETRVKSSLVQSTVTSSPVAQSSPAREPLLECLAREYNSGDTPVHEVSDEDVQPTETMESEPVELMPEMSLAEGAMHMVPADTAMHMVPQYILNEDGQMELVPQEALGEVVIIQDGVVMDTGNVELGTQQYANGTIVIEDDGSQVVMENAGAVGVSSEHVSPVARVIPSGDVPWLKPGDQVMELVTIEFPTEEEVLEESTEGVVEHILDGLIDQVTGEHIEPESQTESKPKVEDTPTPGRSLRGRPKREVAKPRLLEKEKKHITPVAESSPGRPRKRPPGTPPVSTPKKQSKHNKTVNSLKTEATVMGSPHKNLIATPAKIGFLGLGIMGRAMVENLLKSGHEVTVWNRTPSKCKELLKVGALKANSPAEVVSLCDITFSCVSDPVALKDLVFGNSGVLQGIGPNKGYVDMSTVDLETIIDISLAITARGGRFLEAPVSGSKQPAQNGQLVILAAGDRTLYEDCFSCFGAMGKKTFFLGETGNGIKMKLVINMLMGTWLAGLSEAMALAEKVGLDQDELVQALDLSAMSSPLLRSKGQAIMESKFEPHFPLQHQQKDLRLAISMADSVDQPLHVGAAANELFKKAKAKGYGEHDVAAVYRAADM